MIRALALAAAFTHHAAFTATAYCLTGTTATGAPAGPGSVAIDPAVIPLRRRLYVQGYGPGWAADTGGAIRGHRIDLWMRSCAAARRFGVRRVVVSW